MVSSTVALYILGVQPPGSGCCPFAGKVSPVMEGDGWAGDSKGSGALSKGKTLSKKLSFFLTPSLLGQLSLSRGQETELFRQVPLSRGPNRGKPLPPAELASDQRPGELHREQRWGGCILPQRWAQGLGNPNKTQKLLMESGRLCCL